MPRRSYASTHPDAPTRAAGQHTAHGRVASGQRNQCAADSYHPRGRAARPGSHLGQHPHRYHADLRAHRIVAAGAGSPLLAQATSGQPQPVHLSRAADGAAQPRQHAVLLRRGCPRLAQPAGRRGSGHRQPARAGALAATPAGAHHYYLLRAGAPTYVCRPTALHSAASEPGADDRGPRGRCFFSIGLGYVAGGSDAAAGY